MFGSRDSIRLPNVPGLPRPMEDRRASRSWPEKEMQTMPHRPTRFKTLRQAVCEANRELDSRGLILYTWGNVSAIDRDAGVMAIKPSGVPYEELTPDQMVLVDLFGKPLEEGLRPSSDTPTHVELYRCFPEVGAVAHSHSLFATAFAQARSPLPCLGTTHADHFAGPVPVTRLLTPEELEDDYEKNTGKVIVETFHALDPLAVPAVFVAGHGPFTWGKTPAEAVRNSVVLERLARMAAITYALAPDAAPLPEWIGHRHFSRKHGPEAYYGQPSDVKQSSAG